MDSPSQPRAINEKPSNYVAWKGVKQMGKASAVLFLLLRCRQTLQGNQQWTGLSARSWLHAWGPETGERLV